MQGNNYKYCLKIIYIYTFLFLFKVPTVYSQGILFSSNDALISERTSYEVFAYRQPTLERIFALEFELSIQQKETFGYIFTIKDEGQENAFSLIYLNNDSIPELRFNEEGKRNLMTISLNNEEIGAKRKIKCFLKFDLENSRLEFEVNSHRSETEYGISKLKFKPKLVFGKTEHSIDVPAFRLRYLNVISGAKEIKFPLNESDGNYVYDLKGRKFGHISNPTWLINDSYHWKLKKVLKFNEESAVTLNENQQKLIITQSDTMGFFDLVTEELSKSNAVNSLLVPMRLGMSIVNEDQNRLFVYELNDVAEVYNMASMHLDSLRWNNFSTNLFEQQRHHHNSWFDDENNRLYIFGGFGNKKFTNSVNYLDFNSNTWHEQTFSGDTIFPRFFSGIVKYSKTEIILFAGVGNKSGDQSLGKEYYKDCYLMDLSSHVIKKLWHIDSDNDFVSSRNMILSEDSASFYTLNYEEYNSNTLLKLYKYSIEDGAVVEYGDSIPMVSERIRTNANLYLNKGTDELFCVTQEYELDGSNIIKIYSIDFPPVTANHLIKKYKAKRDIYLFVLIPLLLIIVSAYYLLFVRRRKLKNHQKEVSEQYLLKENEINHMLKSNSISLFGNFNVLDYNGRDISYMFSPKLKQLLLILILNLPNEDGVSSEDIYDALWPDKERANAKNLKNVTINQLRKILQELEGLKIIYERASFKLVNSEEANIDFLDFMYHLNHFKENPEESLSLMYSIVCKGTFLKGIDLEFFDKDKQLLENDLIRTLESVLGEYCKSNLHSNIVLVSNILLTVDPINEAALFFIINTYKKLKMTIEAKKVYNAFLVEYLRVYNEDYNRTFDEIMNQTPQKLLEKTN